MNLDTEEVKNPLKIKIIQFFLQHFQETRLFNRVYVEVLSLLPWIALSSNRHASLRHVAVVSRARNNSGKSFLEMQQHLRLGTQMLEPAGQDWNPGAGLYLQCDPTPTIVLSFWVWVLTLSHGNNNNKSITELPWIAWCACGSFANSKSMNVINCCTCSQSLRGYPWGICKPEMSAIWGEGHGQWKQYLKCHWMPGWLGDILSLFLSLGVDLVYIGEQGCKRKSPEPFWHTSSSKLL